MRLIAEIEPLKNREKLLSRLRAVQGLADAVDIPESPLSRPGAHSIAVAHMAVEHVGIEAIAHVRLVDVNWIGFRSLLGAALLLGVRELVVLQGDPPIQGRPVSQVSTEEAIRFVKDSKHAQILRIGAIISLAKTDSEIYERMRIGADFYLASRMSSPIQLSRDPVQEARRRGIRIYPYLVVATEKNREMLEENLNPQLFAGIKDVPTRVKALRGLADGVLISCPGDFEGLLKALRLARNALVS